MGTLVMRADGGDKDQLDRSLAIWPICRWMSSSFGQHWRKAGAGTDPAALTGIDCQSTRGPACLTLVGIGKDQLVGGPTSGDGALRENLAGACHDNLGLAAGNRPFHAIGVWLARAIARKGS